MWRRARRMRARITRHWPRHFRRLQRPPGLYSTAMKDGFPRRLSCVISRATWRSKPKYYAVSTEDRTINPDLERFMAKRMGAKTIEVKASHLSLISQPDTITNLILDAAGQTGAVSS